ncbi:hypothetical protein EKO04_006889 [Ascochyta lentis]|uniref:Uncharacterized protein n=1 Tax=Ascochyta lentis TaxID=205686 RepID=A0A8H7MHG2_9PLEO|nr:hypothetical protein EKO04_006889 [Ascochyta lentis]
MVNWTADKDQTILKGIFAFHKIKISKDFLEYLAAEIGEGCTPKAVSHRLTNLRSSGKAVANSTSSGRQTNNTTPSSSRSFKTAATPRTPRTPKGTALLGRGKTSAKTFDDDVTSDNAASDEMPAFHPVGRKRARSSKTPKSYEESDAADDNSEDEFVPAAKRVKVEVVEDDGIGCLSPTDTVEEEEAFV